MSKTPITLIDSMASHKVTTRLVKVKSIDGNQAYVIPVSGNTGFYANIAGSVSVNDLVTMKVESDGTRTVTGYGAPISSAGTVTDPTGSGGLTSLSWDDITGKPTTFTPSPHTQDWSTILNQPTTDGISEGSTNLYFTTARARASLSATAPITYSTSTGGIGLDITTALSSNPFTSGTTGWSINLNGDAELRSLTLRDSLHAQTFVTDLISATAGVQVIAKSAGTLAADMIVPASGTWVMTINDPPGSTSMLFASGDIIQVKLAIAGAIKSTWFTVDTGTSNSNGTQYYTCTHQSGDQSITYGTGVGVIDYGTSGQGLLYSTASDTYGPYFDVRTHAGAPWTTQTTRLRIGNLRGWDTTDTDRYGIGIGDFSGGNYLRYNPSDGFLLSAGNGGVIIDRYGIKLPVGTDLLRFGNSDWLYGYMDARLDSAVSGQPKWIELIQQSTGTGGIRINAATAYATQQYQSTLLLKDDGTIEMGDGYIYTTPIGDDPYYAWHKRHVGITANGMTIDAGLNVGTSTGAGTGELKASGSGTFAGGLNVGTATGATEGQIHASSTSRIIYPNQDLTQNTSGDAQVHLALMTSDTQAANNGGAIGFGGKYTNAGGTALFGAIAGRKSNSTSESTAGYMAFLTTNAASPYGLTEWMRLTSVGTLLVGRTSAVGTDGPGNAEINGSLRLGGAFGCNGNAAQTKYASGGALPSIPATAFGIGADTESHWNAILTLITNMRAALVANGIMS